MTNYLPVAVILDAEGVVVEPGTDRVREELRVAVAQTRALIFLATGRRLDFCDRIWRQLPELKGVFAENGAIHQFHDEPPYTIADTESLAFLKNALGVEQVTEERIRISVNGVSLQMVLDPKQCIFSVVPIEGCGWEPARLKQLFLEVISQHQLPIELTGPHWDGGWDFQPFCRKDGKPVNKGRAVEVILERFPQIRWIIPVGDGDNDLPMLEYPDSRVVPATVLGASREVEEAVRKRNGWVVLERGWESGCTTIIAKVGELCREEGVP